MKKRALELNELLFRSFVLLKWIFAVMIREAVENYYSKLFMKIKIKIVMSRFPPSLYLM